MTNEPSRWGLRFPARSGSRPWMRWLSAIRLDEVLVLQGPPFLGLAFGAARRSLPHPTTLTLLIFLVASCGLIAHVFALNDWSEMVDRPARTGLSRREMAGLWIALLAASLFLFAFLGLRPLLLALGIAALSVVYSAPFPHAKGIPVLSSALHLSGGLFHFLLGYAVAAEPDLRAFVVGSGLALTFAGGHLTQEVRDYGEDLRDGTRTNAVAFGKATAFAAGFALFTLGFGVLFAVAVGGLVPRVLALVVLVLYPFHVIGSIRALKSRFASDQVRGFQWRYRSAFAILGIAIVTALLHSS